MTSRPARFAFAVLATMVTVAAPASAVINLTEEAVLNSGIREFGIHAVAIDGDTAVVGEPKTNRLGKVYIYVRDAGGGWTEQAVLDPPLAIDAASFGKVVALEGDTLAVAQHGHVYIFERNGTSWSHAQTLVGSDGGFVPDSGGANQFGTTLSLANGILVTGGTSSAGTANCTACYADRAWVFENLNGAWVETAILTGSDIATDNRQRFGWDVSTNGASIAVSAIMNNDAVYMFDRDGMGGWIETAKITTTAAQREFGTSIELEGNLLAVGDPLASTPLGSFSGAAHIFSTDGAGAWVQEAVLTEAELGGTNSYHGTEVAIEGDLLLVGTPRGGSARGYVYAYQFDGDAWRRRDRLECPSSVDGDTFGTALGADGDLVMIGGCYLDHVDWLSEVSIYNRADVALTTSCAEGTINYVLRTNGDIQVGDSVQVELSTSPDCVVVPGPCDGLTCYSCLDSGVLQATVTVTSAAEVESVFVTPYATGSAERALLSLTDTTADSYAVNLDYGHFSNAVWPADIATFPPTLTLFTSSATSGSGELFSLLPEDLDIGGFEASSSVIWRWYLDDDVAGGQITDSAMFQYVLNKSCGATPPPADEDGDGVPDVDDACPGFDDNIDNDGDGVADGCDACPFDNPDDGDDDGICESDDNCPADPNANQSDVDGDGVGDVCEPDSDGDGVINDHDNCLLDFNPDQADADSDGIGDVCDLDSDDDGVIDADDACLGLTGGDPVDASGCTIGQECPCDGGWKNHGAYVSCVSHAAGELESLGLITPSEKGDIVSAAGQSTCGHKKKK